MDIQQENNHHCVDSSYYNILVSKSSNVITNVHYLIDNISIQSLSGKTIDANCNTISNLILQSNEHATLSVGTINKNNYIIYNTTLIGHNAGKMLTCGSSNNTFVGANTGILTTNSFNTFVGSNAGSLTNNSNNTCIGYNAGYIGSGTNNVAIGNSALYNNNSFANIAIGTNSLFNNSGSNNIAIGKNTLYDNTTGYNNLVIGNNSLNVNQTGENNIAFGHNITASSNNSSSVVIGNCNNLVNNIISIGHGINNNVEHTAVINKQFASSNQIPQGPTLSVNETSSIGTPITCYATPRIDASISNTITLTIPPSTIFIPTIISTYNITATSATFTVTNGNGQDYVLNGPLIADINRFKTFVISYPPDRLPITNTIVITNTVGTGTFRVFIQGILQQI